MHFFFQCPSRLLSLQLLSWPACIPWHMFSRMITCATDLNRWPYLFYGICHPQFTMKISLCCIPASSKLSSSVLQAFYVLSVLCKLCCCHLGLGILLSFHAHQQNAENHAMKNFCIHIMFISCYCYTIHIFTKVFCFSKSLLVYFKCSLG